ncbi:MAG TPA: hybrid sensor histidine kinase/response regulator [Crinalium sp.]|jgi:signal transduction histidine kinase
MNSEALQVLLVEDSPTDAQLFQHVFFRAATGNWTLIHAERLDDAIAYCQTDRFQVALLDLRLPDSDGLDTISQFHQAVPDVPIIILTVFDDEELALQAMAQGAQDYLVKDQVTTQLLRRSIRYTLERSQIIQQLKDSERATLEALDKERELNQLKSYFISMVSHEFRNPLSTLRVMSEMLLRFDGALEAERKAFYSQQISTVINHMCQLLDEVILLGKVETGHFLLELKPLDLKEFCEGLINSFQYSDNHQHPITLNYLTDLTLIELDASLLQHILANLISNALKYSPIHEEVQLEVQYRNDTIVFCVSDRGIGIPEADQPRLFETFSRCSNVGKIQGTGLGLSIVKRCVDVWGGAIEVDSKVGLGTTVTVALPIKLNS